jgi:imidazolonepropionase
MQDVGVIVDGAVAIADGIIVACGPSGELCATYQAKHTIDATGKCLCPGFVDCHTHLVFGGERTDEFELRIKGATYLEMMAAGGGIVSTVRATREASLEQLVHDAHRRLAEMLRLGTTTVEGKSGYGLDTATELKLMQALDALQCSQPVDLVPTFLGAHAIPPEYAGRTDDYVDLVTREMAPAIAAWYRASHFAAAGVPLFTDVFCERNAFDVVQSRRVLEACTKLGMRVKAHVDEFTDLGGVDMALALGATSIDHLDATGAEGIARIAASETIAVVLPAVNFNLGSTHYADARGLIDMGAAVALSTDLNPGSAPCPSLPLAMAIACRYQHVLPSEALNAVTINAAHAVGLGQRAGSLEVGKQADVLIINAPDYRHLAQYFGTNLVECVIKRGRIVNT